MRAGSGEASFSLSTCRCRAGSGTDLNEPRSAPAGTHNEDERLRPLFAQGIRNLLRSMWDRLVVQSFVGDVQAEED